MTSSIFVQQSWLSMLGVVLASFSVWLTSSCSIDRHAVISSTGTSIGLEIAQNPQNQLYEAKLGYHRGELAIVPSNRSAKKEAGKVGQGAEDTTDTIMELKYSNIFATKNSGIYQRLAVGKNAVNQPGAAFMFARDASGKLSAKTADVVADVTRIQGQKTSVPGINVLNEIYRLLSNAGTSRAQTLVNRLDKLPEKLPLKDFEAYQWRMQNQDLAIEEIKAQEIDSFKEFLSRYRAKLKESIETIKELLQIHSASSVTKDGEPFEFNAESLAKVQGEQRELLTEIDTALTNSEIVNEAVAHVAGWYKVDEKNKQENENN